jgi:hypothetical protein
MITTMIMTTTSTNPKTSLERPTHFGTTVGRYATETFINSNSDALARPEMGFGEIDVFLPLAFVAVGPWRSQRA